MAGERLLPVVAGETSAGIPDTRIEPSMMMEHLPRPWYLAAMADLSPRQALRAQAPPAERAPPPRAAFRQAPARQGLVVWIRQMVPVWLIAETTRFIDLVVPE